MFVGSDLGNNPQKKHELRESVGETGREVISWCPEMAGQPTSSHNATSTWTLPPRFAWFCSIR